MRIRLHGTEAECQATAERLTDVLDVLDVSRAYPDRPPSRLVRLYLTISAPTTNRPTSKEA